MYMTEYEICTRYQQAKHKQQQITILSEINCCTVSEIKSILRKSGIRLEKPKCRTRKIDWNREITPILRMVESGMTYQQIGKRYGVSAQSIQYGIKRHKEEQE